MTGARRGATLALAVGAVVLVGGPAPAEERVVRVTRDGVQPQVLRAEPGDTVRFVNDDPTFAYRAQSTGGPWRFDSGPTTLLEQDFVVPSAVTAPGTYGYRVAQDPPFSGSVVVGDGTPPAAAPPATTPAAGSAGAPPTPAPLAAPAVPGPLAGPTSTRALGLAVAVAAVLVGGTASLLLRLLLALPAGAERPARR